MGKVLSAKAYVSVVMTENQEMIFGDFLWIGKVSDGGGIRR